MEIVIMTNKNARIVSRIDRTGKQRTETRRRDAGRDFAVSTNAQTGATRLFVDSGDRVDNFPSADLVDLTLSGHELRTLYLLLKRHLVASEKPV